MIAAIVAGGRVDGVLARAMGTTIKALAPIGATTPLERAIAGARAAGAHEVVVVGGDEVRARVAGSVDRIVPESGDGRENIRRAVEASAERAVLLMASDLPFLDGRAVAAFVERARAADLALPLADADAYARAYPGAPSHETPLGGERIVNGSIVYFAPGIAPRVLDVSQKLFAARKSLLRMALLLGPGLLARFATRRLRVEHVEARAAQLFGIRAHAVRDSAPGLCFDIDGIEDYRYALAHAAQLG